MILCNRLAKVDLPAPQQPMIITLFIGQRYDKRLLNPFVIYSEFFISLLWNIKSQPMIITLFIGQRYGKRLLYQFCNLFRVFHFAIMEYQKLNHIKQYSFTLLMFLIFLLSLIRHSISSMV